MFPVPSVPGTLPLVGHRVTSKPQQVVGAGGATPLQYARHQDVCPGRQGSSSPRMHTGHRMRTTGTHTQSCAALGPSLPVVLLGHGDCSMEKTDREAWRWKNCSNQKGIREAGDSAKSETGIFFFGWGTNRRMELQSVKMRTALLPCLKARVHSLAAIQ